MRYVVFALWGFYLECGDTIMDQVVLLFGLSVRYQNVAYVSYEKGGNIEKLRDSLLKKKLEEAIMEIDFIKRGGSWFMLRAKRRRMRRTNRASMGLITLAVLILFGVLTYKTVALDKQTSKYQETINGYQKDLKKLEQEKDDIKDLKEYVESDSYIEEMAREKLGLVYKDEVIFQAKDEDK